nr:MAG TPA: zinc-ribbon domain protein [Caudoviricetes sp.]
MMLREVYASMPLAVNVKGYKENYKKVACPKCGRECLRLSNVVDYKQNEIVTICTECMIKKIREEL